MGLEATVAKVKTTIVPSRLIYQGQTKRIRRVNRNFVINSYEIYLAGRIILKVKIDASHPNCDPDTNEFCISDNLKHKVIDQKILPTLENMFKTFNLDNCYYQPWEDFTI